MTRTGTATLTEATVRHDLLPETVAQVWHFDPPLEGDDGERYDLGIALDYRGFVDVFAYDRNRPGYAVEEALFDLPVLNSWVSLINCCSINGPTTIEAELERCGYEVAR